MALVVPAWLYPGWMGQGRTCGWGRVLVEGWDTACAAVAGGNTPKAV